MKRPNWIYAVSIIVLAFGLYVIVPDRGVCNPSISIDKLEQKCEISYQGIAGKNALEILKSNHNVETKKFSFGEMVQSIDGVKAPTTHFWSFNVNGKMAEVGAGDYQTKSSDRITWKLVSVSSN
ncbi:hypothetical protein A3A71_03095 [Candidatus Berkelbacteria bacterium RIFCSPLOWO2_01_FULL_50_28]|uniref:Transcobalamin-like C-terminal domain-containing protein n=1 Tax=Candidatus Berkelbacteria bacterium RIFCSPLOWO2_01_FULL_50_28 TaxID=1797471 RepID=A0A1F5ECH1_9BACT|nr:MAG: hypothetical protein A2807_02660 [Candidatus Berkelbacteria bacterium RIFCSPHIGHO2_01_FULL_50_36]OGD63778.1 MAG: hypothetical protein A3F39_03495 [Candidatus Berkelbacteria bacterium RIFCSPHIGHO2_12_FULL_50_11]OGD65051.1 MAG: hypothetical protein A3A71_03095 [Candidatus Berkelbacteria bacterium RIFCSPLOWO2_01_FULL_50_28]